MRAFLRPQVWQHLKSACGDQISTYYLSMSDNMAVRIFFSYCHTDEPLRDKLEVHLTMLKRQGLIETWHDRKIIAGSEIDSTITTELNAADIVLFLVSSDFLASNYCYDREVTRALERHHERSARVIPVILRPCEWQHAPFGKLLATPTDGKPVSRWTDLDEAFLSITTSIRNAVKELGTAPAPGITKSFDAPLNTQSIAAIGPRSSNMRISKNFTQRDRAVFLDETFVFMTNFFRNSLEELEARNEKISTRFRIIDADRFSAVIYHDGNQASACTIFRGGLAGGTTQICYSYEEGASTNGFNESVSVDADEQSLFMAPLGMSYSARQETSKKLTPEGVAELFWSMLMEPLQRPRHGRFIS